MKNFSEIEKEFNLNLANELIKLEEKDLKKISQVLIEKLGPKKKIADLILDEKYFSSDKINMAKLFEKEVYKSRDLLKEILNEPSYEKELITGVTKDMKGNTVYTTNTYEYFELYVPIPGGHIDLVGIHKPRWSGKSLCGIELKIAKSVADIRNAFGQAKNYLRYCNEAFVVFSFKSFLKFDDRIAQYSKDNKKIGVLIANKIGILKEYRKCKWISYPEKWKDESLKIIERQRS